jgi:tripartite-type tricarboxylate transporter receptor subunit TctC
VSVASAPALTDLLGGQVQAYFGSTVSSTGYIRTGKLRALAVTGATRSDVLPDIPTVAAGFEASIWQGVGAPMNTPAHVISKLNNEINAALVTAMMKSRIADFGGATSHSSENTPWDKSGGSHGQSHYHLDLEFPFDGRHIRADDNSGRAARAAGSGG